MEKEVTKDDFIARFRGRHLLFLVEAWACRKEDPTSLGILMDRHALDCKRLLGEMYDTLCPPLAPKPPVNGAAALPLRKGTT